MGLQHTEISHELVKPQKNGSAIKWGVGGKGFPLRRTKTIWGIFFTFENF